MVKVYRGSHHRCAGLNEQQCGTKEDGAALRVEGGGGAGLRNRSGWQRVVATSTNSTTEVVKHTSAVEPYLQAGVLGIGSGGSISSIDLHLKSVNVSLQGGLPSLQGGHGC